MALLRLSRYKNNDRIGGRREGARNVLSPPAPGRLQFARARRLTGSGGPAAERGDGLLLTVINLKNRDQFGDGQRIPQALTQSSQFDVGAARTCRRVNAD